MDHQTTQPLNHQTTELEDRLADALLPGLLAIAVLSVVMVALGLIFGGPAP